MKSCVKILSLLSVCALVWSGAAAEWSTNDYATAVASCQERHIPLVAYYGMRSCGYCSMMKRAFESKTFKNWMASREYVFVDGSGDANAHKDMRVPSGEAPYVRIFWAKRDGTVVDSRFSGRCGSIPGTTADQDLRNDALASALIAAVDDLVGDYVPFVYEPSSFDTDAAHPLEVEPGLTTNLIIGLNRPAGMSDGVTTNLFIVGDVTNEIVWAIGEKRRELSFTDTKGHSAGDRIPLALTDPERPEDGVQSETAIVFVAPQPCSVVNPRAPGEPFAFGEWTLDYAAARAAVRAKPGARLLVLFSGVLWCPYCKGMESSLLAAPSFYTWAKENDVALVLFDQGRASSPATAAGRQAPRLVTYGLDPNGTGASGASYASRHMITAEMAEAYMALVTRMTADCLAPESTAARCGNPTVVLLDPETEAPIGRLNALRDDQKAYDPVENIARLGDLVKLTTRTELDARPTTTSLSVPVTGRVEAVALQVNDARRVFRVREIRARTVVTFGVGVTPARDVTMTLYKTDSTAANAETLATGVNTVSYAFRKPLDNVFLEVSSFARSEAYGADTGFSFPVEGTEAVDPTPIDTEFALYKGFEVERVIESEPVGSLSAAKVKVISGALPRGLKVAYDRSSGCLSVSGTPKACMSSSAVVAVTGKAADGSVVTKTVTLVFDVAEPASVNPFAGSAQEVTLPVYDDGSLVGLLEVKTTVRNKLKAKYAGAGKKMSFSGAWQEIDDDGTALAGMSLSGGASLDLALTADGRWSVRLVGVGGRELVASDLTALQAGELPRYAGNYTVTLPAEGRGTGSLVFSVKGQRKVSVTGTLPDGTSVKATGCLLSDGPDAALLPVLVATSKDVLAAELRIAADGRTRQVQEPMTIVGKGGAFWSHTASGYTFTAPLAVYGAWYDAAADLEAYCLRAYDLEGDTVVMKADVDVLGFVPGASGAPAAPETLDVSVTSSGLKVVDAKKWLKLAFVKKTGVVTGTATLSFPQTGKTVKAKLKGVVLPGWYDCGCGEGIVDRPFVSAAVYFKDKVDGKSVTLSCALDLRAETQIRDL